MIKEVYLHSYILECIINYIYNRSRFFEISQNNNEIINYSIVCRSWFNLTSKIIINTQRFRNYDNIFSLIEDPILNQKFKLIKYIDSNKYINCLDEYNDLLNKNNKKIVNLNQYENIESFDNIYNVKFRSMELDIFLNVSKDNNKDILNVKCLRVYNKYDLLKSLSLNTNNIYYMDREDNRFNIFIGFKSNNNNKINIDNLFIPSDSKLTLSNLNKFYTKLSANHLLKVLKDDLCNNIIKDAWDCIVNTLSNCSSLHELIYFHFCRVNNCNCGSNRNEGITPNEFNNGIKTIIASSNTNLKTLRFSPGPIDETLYDALQLNTTIRDISIQASCLSNLIIRVLINNRSIRNVLINARDNPIQDQIKLMDGLKVLTDPQYLNHIDLYSISIQTETDNINNIIELLTINNIKFNIKEFNIININSNIQNTIQFNYNNSIFNIKNFKL